MVNYAGYEDSIKARNFYLEIYEDPQTFPVYDESLKWKSEDLVKSELEEVENNIYRATQNGWAGKWHRLILQCQRELVLNRSEDIKKQKYNNITDSLHNVRRILIEMEKGTVEWEKIKTNLSSSRLKSRFSKHSLEEFQGQENKVIKAGGFLQKIHTWTSSSYRSLSNTKLYLSR